MSTKYKLMNKSFIDIFLTDLAELIISDDRFANFNDRLLIQIKDIWRPQKHNYFIITSIISDFNHPENNYKIESIMDWFMLNRFNKNTPLEEVQKEEVFKKEFNSMLLELNQKQIKYGNLYFISSNIPSREKLLKERNNFNNKFSLMMETILLPKIAHEYCSNLGKTIYTIKLYDPMFDINPSDEASILSLKLDIMDESSNLLDQETISVVFPYSNWDGLSWIYPDLNTLNYNELIIKCIDEFASREQMLNYGNISLILFSYDGLSQKEKFILNDKRDPNHEVMILFDKLYEENFFLGLIDNVEKLHNDIKRLALKNLNNDEPKFITIGPGGISSLQEKIYDPNDPNYRDPDKAIQIIADLIGNYSDRLPLLIAIYDRRRTNKIYKMLDNGGEF